jgi:SsrA-binding protein
VKKISENKKAYFNYELLDRFEAGLALNGQEVKSIKTFGVNLAGSYVVLRNGEFFWIGAKVPPYQPGNAPSNYEEERARKILLTKAEIRQLIGKTAQKGLTMVPLVIYTKAGKINLEFALAKGKKKFDKKELIRKRETEKELKRIFKGGE